MKNSVRAKQTTVILPEKNQLDAILESALDEFEEQQLNNEISNMTAQDVQDKNDTNPELLQQQEKQKELEKMQNIMNTFNDPRFGQTLQGTLKSLSSNKEGNENVDDLFLQLSKEFEKTSSKQKSSLRPIDDDDEIEIIQADREIAGVKHMLATAQAGMEGFEANRLEEAGELMMEDMMAQFEELGEKKDYQEAIDNVMKQLLAR